MKKNIVYREVHEGNEDSYPQMAQISRILK